jgi:DnaD/phage-associated family protein
MAKYRQVHVEFWQDGFVLDLTPEEKYFYIYLMTNSKTSQCGIYELPKRIIETETGYNRETVDKLLSRFIEYGKIKYDDMTKELLLVNWIKYNAIRSPKVISCIQKELESVKNKGFVRELISNCIQYGYRIDTLSIDYGEEEEKEEEEEREEEREKEQQQQEQKENPSLADVSDFYQQNFGMINPYMSEAIIKWIQDLSAELVLEAMKRALLQGKRWKYADGILKEWANRGVWTLQDVQALDAEFRRKREGPDIPGKPKTKSEYDYDF